MKVNACNCAKSKRVLGLSKVECESKTKYIEVDVIDGACIYCGYYTMFKDLDRQPKGKRVKSPVDDEWLNGGFK